MAIGGLISNRNFGSLIGSDGFNVTKGNTRTTMMLRRMESKLKSEEDDMTEAAAVDSLESTEGEAVLASPWWEQFPKRWVIVLLCFTAFLLCNMDRILCVRDNSSWKLGTVHFNCKVNMSIAILPMSQEFDWNSVTVGLSQSLFFGGYLLTQGVAMPAMNNILSKWIPVSERSRSLALVYSGMYLGSVTGLAISPILIHKLGWPFVFYSFGSLGSIWFALWIKKPSQCFFQLFSIGNSNYMYGKRSH
ncbi:hypothetical protein NC651_006507 [Populus alba x Populus x berolinensis]|nr:hypothetical protein NC651_006507 [Populus alba x Populus x berolinensis]